MQRHVKNAKGLIRQMTVLSPPPKVLLGGQALRDGEGWAPKSLICRVAGNVVEGLKIARDLLNSESPKTVLDAYLKEFGSQVRQLRSQAGWTQQRLADLTGLTRAYIVSVEGGKQNISLDVVVRVANALGVTPDRLLATDGAPRICERSLRIDLSRLGRAKLEISKAAKNCCLQLGIT